MVDEKSPSGLPVAVIVYVPARTSATVNEPGVRMPPKIEQLGEATGVPDSVQLVSPAGEPGSPHQNLRANLSGGVIEHEWIQGDAEK